MPNSSAKCHCDMCSMSVNKQRYWMALMLIHLNGAYVGGALISLFMKCMNNISNVKVHLKTCSGNVNTSA